jgi:serine phosphatase RsbU (regulator of sigma subunit)
MNWISSPVAIAQGFAQATRVDISSVLGRFQQQSRASRIAVFFMLFALTAWLDLIVDRDLSLFALYLIPTLYSGWYLGTGWAYGSCFAGGVVWFIDDWPGWRHYHHVLVPYGNLAGRISVLTIIVAIVSALRNALEDQYKAERRVVERDLEIASEVQKRLLPAEPPDCSGLDLAFAYRGAQQLSGDYYDFIPLSSERIAITVGDVSGKGLPGALLMAATESLVRSNLAMREGKLARFASELNARLYAETATERYVTLFFAIVDTSSQELHYVNAGHNPPLFFRKWTLTTGRSVPGLLDKGGPPLGLFPATQYLSGHTALQEGDVLVLYTDGVLDALNAEQQRFGEARLTEVVRASLSQTSAEICRSVMDRLDAFTSGDPQWDDITLMVIKVKTQFADTHSKSPEKVTLSTV